MSILNKKKLRIHDRIIELEDFLKTSLARKESSKTEVNVPKIINEISNLKKQLAEM